MTKPIKTEKKQLPQLSTEELKSVNGGRGGINRPRGPGNRPNRGR